MRDIADDKDPNRAQSAHRNRGFRTDELFIDPIFNEILDFAERQPDDRLGAELREIYRPVIIDRELDLVVFITVKLHINRVAGTENVVPGHRHI